MLPVYGTLGACGGLLIFSLMLNIVRRPTTPEWLKSRIAREIAVFASIIALVGGLGTVAAFFTTRNHPPLNAAELLSIGAAVLATLLTAWKIHRPIPPEELPTPVLGFDTTNIGPQTPTPANRKRAA